MDHDQSKKVISMVLVVTLMGMVLMMAGFVSCHNNINNGQVRTDHHQGNWKNTSNNFRHMHYQFNPNYTNGKMNMAGGKVQPSRLSCNTEDCNVIDQDCLDGCICIPVVLLWDMPWVL